MFFCAAFVYNICETVTVKVRNAINEGLSWWSRVIQKSLPCKRVFDKMEDFKEHQIDLSSVIITYN